MDISAGIKIDIGQAQRRLHRPNAQETCVTAKL